MNILVLSVAVTFAASVAVSNGDGDCAPTDNICYADAAKTQVVDDRCISTSPTANIIGEWHFSPSDWVDSVCDDTTCTWRCNVDGVAKNSDVGTHAGIGEVAECFRTGCTYHACYADEAKTQVVDFRCIATTPNASTIGEWYRIESGWGQIVCDDSTCVWRCNADGVAFHSDHGSSYGVGDVVECIRDLDCIDEIPAGLKPNYCISTCERYSSNGYCDKDWSDIAGCFEIAGSVSGLIKNDCKASCNNCPVKPRQTTITDWGFGGDCPRGWYDMQDQGVPNDYCRWVGNCGCQGGSCTRVDYSEVQYSWWSCALAGSSGQYTANGQYDEADSLGERRLK